MCGEREAEGNLTRNTSLTPSHSVPSQQKIDTSRLAFEDMECHIYYNFNAWATRATITQLHKKARGKNAAARLPALTTLHKEAQGCNLRTQNNFSTRDFQMNYCQGTSCWQQWNESCGIYEWNIVPGNLFEEDDLFDRVAWKRQTKWSVLPQLCSYGNNIEIINYFYLYLLLRLVYLYVWS